MDQPGSAPVSLGGQPPVPDGRGHVNRGARLTDHVSKSCCRLHPHVDIVHAFPYCAPYDAFFDPRHVSDRIHSSLLTMTQPLTGQTPVERTGRRHKPQLHA